MAVNHRRFQRGNGGGSVLVDRDGNMEPVSIRGRSVELGDGCNVTGTGSVALGEDLVVPANNHIAAGDSRTAVGVGRFSAGSGATSLSVGADWGVFSGRIVQHINYTTFTDTDTPPPTVTSFGPGARVNMINVAARNLTLSTGAELDAAIEDPLSIGMGWWWSVRCTGGSVTFLPSAGHTVSGFVFVQGDDDGMFMTRRTGVATWATERIMLSASAL